MSDIEIEVQKREALGKNANRRLRAAGIVPAVVYGGGKDPVTIQVGQRKIDLLLRSPGGENAVFLLKMAGTDQSRHTMIRDRMVDPLTGKTLHLDFQRIDMEKKVQVGVPIEIHGEAEGVKNEGGLLDFMTREIEVECLPAKIPSHLVVDVSELHLGQHVSAGELELPEAVALVDDPEKVIVSVVQSRMAMVSEEEEEELLTAAPEEPEVIGRTSSEDEGED